MDLTRSSVHQPKRVPHEQEDGEGKDGQIRVDVRLVNQHRGEAEHRQHAAGLVCSDTTDPTMKHISKSSTRREFLFFARAPLVNFIFFV
jgi:DNA-binding PucR family transcriptional regulator